MIVILDMVLFYFVEDGKDLLLKEYSNVWAVATGAERQILLRNNSILFFIS